MSGAMAAVIIDAGVGNLGNLERALRHLGARTVITEEPEVVRRGHCLLLPGVGAFRPPRERLRGGLEDAVQEALRDGAWLLGICIGFQLLFDGSEEFGATDGLGLVSGTVTRLPDGVPLPHIGWNRLFDLAEHPFLDGVDEGSYAYFVHSFAPDGIADETCLARCLHGRAFPAVVAKGRVVGTQFHPEKSGAVGLRLLQNYLDLVGGSGS